MISIIKLYHYFSQSKNKILGNDENIQFEFICPISYDLMEDPVIVDNRTYDNDSIVEWLKRSNKNPFTNLEFENISIIPNIELKERIIQYKIIKYKYNIFQKLYITNSRFKYCIDSIYKWLHICLHILFHMFIKSIIDILVFIIVTNIRMYLNIPKYIFNIYNNNQMSIDFAISKFSVLMFLSICNNYMNPKYYKKYYTIEFYIIDFIANRLSLTIFTYSRASIKYYFGI